MKGGGADLTSLGIKINYDSFLGFCLDDIFKVGPSTVKVSDSS